MCIFSWSSWSSVQLGVVQWRHIISGGGRAGAARRGRRGAGPRLAPRAVPGLGLRSPTGCASFTLIREKNKRWPHARTKANKREAAHRPPCFMVDCCGTGPPSRVDSHFNCPLQFLPHNCIMLIYLLITFSTAWQHTIIGLITYLLHFITKNKCRRWTNMVKWYNHGFYKNCSG